MLISWKVKEWQRMPQFCSFYFFFLFSCFVLLLLLKYSKRHLQSLSSHAGMCRACVWYVSSSIERSERPKKKKKEPLSLLFSLARVCMNFWHVQSKHRQRFPHFWKWLRWDFFFPFLLLSLLSLMSSCGASQMALWVIGKECELWNFNIFL